MKTMKTLLIASAMVLGMTGASMAQSTLDNYNATLNSPAGKAQLLDSVCSGTSPVSQVQCDNFKRNGVPDSDVRIGIIATAGVAGGAIGAAVATVPVAFLGGETLAAHWGIVTLGGVAVTAASLGTVGAVVGAGTAAVVTQ